jgi:hypothetical protein
MWLKLHNISEILAVMPRLRNGPMAVIAVEACGAAR